MSEIAGTRIEGKAFCTATLDYCRCREPRGHDGPHACPSPCAGMWTGTDAGGDLEIVRLPQADQVLPQFITDLAAWKEW